MPGIFQLLPRHHAGRVNSQGSFEFVPRHLILLLMQELDSLANVELSGFKLCLIHFHLQSHILGVFFKACS